MKTPFKKRRAFLKKTATISGVTAIGLPNLASEPLSENTYKGSILQITPPKNRSYFEPLEEIKITLSKDAYLLTVTDSQGRIYFRTKPTNEVTFKAAGSLGYHQISLTDKKGNTLDTASFTLHCETSLKDKSGTFTELYDVLYKTLYSSGAQSGKIVRYNQNYYRYFSSWFQDHVFVAEGLKYFENDLKTGIDLYADGQREDGLIWDNYKHPYPKKQSYWEYRFDYGDFVYRPEDTLSTAIFVRIPVENIGEHVFIEGLYYAWKATGDTEWMKSRLNHALKAVQFATSSPWYWNEEKQLLKRPFSIDRWDFQSDFDSKITQKDFMGADLEKTRYGIMFGDNICMANACQWLSEMLEEVGRNDDASKMLKLSKDLWQRINQLSWNGKFYKHWVPVENKQEIDFGVDTDQQITLSNAMALLRGLDHEKAVEVIKSYQGLRDIMPESSPGEWFLCYPPFEKGWHVNKWEYMNGGVSPIVAGDLALGAFEHGFEAYGADILIRQLALAKKSPNHYLDGCYKGKMPEEPQRKFTEVNLTDYTTHSFIANKNIPHGWLGGEEADLRNLPTGKQTFANIPFDVIPPKTNDDKSCAVISSKENCIEKLELPINQNAQSLYILHTSTSSSVAGMFSIEYTDGTRFSKYIEKNKEVGHFWYPTIASQQNGIPSTLVAWSGSSKVVQEVGIYIFGMENPHPEKTIKHLGFSNPMKSEWILIGLTLSDGPHFLPTPIGSTIPPHWAAAHVFKAMMEGMAGIISTGKAFEKATLKPKWEAANITEAEVTARYAPSNSYLRYRYRKTENGAFEVTFSTNGDKTTVELLLPKGKKPKTLSLNGKEVAFTTKTVEQSKYACLKVEGVGVKKILMQVG